MEVLVVTPARPEAQSLHPGINYYTQRAHLVERFVGDDGQQYYKVALLTDIYGRIFTMPLQSIVRLSSIKFLDAAARNANTTNNETVTSHFYHRDRANRMTATGFVDTGDPEGLVNVGRIPLGSGIYGKYFPDDVQATGEILPEESIYRMIATDCYNLIDGPHGDSLVLSSLTTNRYIMVALQQQKSQITTDQLNHLLTLWRMVFARSGEENKITTELLSTVVATYITNYHEILYIDDDNHYLQLQPINALLGSLGYQGIFASDSYNNGRDRGCVLFDVSIADDYRVGHAQY